MWSAEALLPVAGYACTPLMNMIASLSYLSKIWGALHFIVPRTPFRMARYAIHIRPSYKAGLCPICYDLRFNGKKRLITTAMVDLYIHNANLKAQAAPATRSSASALHIKPKTLHQRGMKWFQQTLFNNRWRRTEIISLGEVLRICPYRKRCSTKSLLVCPRR